MNSSRREFLGKTALFASGAIASSALGMPVSAKGRNTSANEKLVAGVIGCKGMGFANLESFLKQPNTECGALCDVDENVLNERISDVEKIQGKKPKGFKDFRKMLEYKGLDVIIIGTPDHWHALQFIYASQQGYDIYCEKPLGNTVYECDLMEKAANRYGNVVQVGQWHRSTKSWQDAVKYVHSGKLGNIREVRSWTYLSWLKPAIKKANCAVPSGVDYDMWLGPAPKRDFNPNRFHFNFRWYWDYAGGLMTDWGVHIIDYALYGMQKYAPKSVMAIGGKHAYPDSAGETPDTLKVLYEFDDFSLSWSHAIGIDNGDYGRQNGVGFVGNNGTLVVGRRTGWEVIPEKDDKGNNKIDREYHLTSFNLGLDNHVSNFIDCVKTRETPNCPIDVAAGVARLSHLGNIAYRTGKRLDWDTENHVFVNDQEANALLKPTYRKPWSLPENP
ncbi:Gfo/Idh/MocA family oxidoreductase [uncultured Draconibacterium sp.]|uniref:Gfo/Idh/MocA family protein n=1 Tax=uncultured Draconibacterium sp. TaxID=1573823 RepID=UPI0025F31FCB|nr:Gfo/Idh/MocA family oxidoreductase [uncultured Draconibacterium sp.]